MACPRKSVQQEMYRDAEHFTLHRIEGLPLQVSFTIAAGAPRLCRGQERKFPYSDYVGTRPHVGFRWAPSATELSPSTPRQQRLTKRTAQENHAAYGRMLSSGDRCPSPRTPFGTDMICPSYRRGRTRSNWSHCSRRLIARIGPLRTHCPPRFGGGVNFPQRFYSNHIFLK